MESNKSATYRCPRHYSWGSRAFVEMQGRDEMMDMSGLRSNDQMERKYNRNNGRITGNDAMLDYNKYKKYRDVAERAAKIYTVVEK